MFAGYLNLFWHKMTICLFHLFFICVVCYLKIYLPFKNISASSQITIANIVAQFCILYYCIVTVNFSLVCYFLPYRSLKCFIQPHLSLCFPFQLLSFTLYLPLSNILNKLLIFSTSTTGLTFSHLVFDLIHFGV